MKLALGIDVTGPGGWRAGNVSTFWNLSPGKLAEIAKMGKKLVTHAKKLREPKNPDAVLKFVMSAKVDGKVSPAFPGAVIEGITYRGWEEQRLEWSLLMEDLLNDFDQKRAKKKK